MSPSSRQKVEEEVVKLYYYYTCVAWHMYHDYARNYFWQSCSCAVSVDQCTASYAFLYISPRRDCGEVLPILGTWHQPAKAGLCYRAW
jgi:hypothetical protein